MPQDFSGQNLRGRNFKDQDLTGANFSYADIRGANFTNAILRDANFTGAKAGLQKRWALCISCLSLFLPIASGFLAGFTGWYSLVIFNPINIATYGSSTRILAILLIVLFSITALRKGLESALSTLTMSGVLIALITGLKLLAQGLANGLTGANVASKPNPGAFFLSLLITILTTGTLATTFAVAAFMNAIIIATRSIFFVVVGILSGIVIFTLFIVVFIIPTIFPKAPISPFDISFIAYSYILTTAIMILLPSYLCWKAFNGDRRYSFIWRIAAAFVSIGGTTFRASDLTNANFSRSILKSTDFRECNLTRARWINAQNLNLAILGRSYLENLDVQRLVETNIGQSQNFSGLNLEGINLQEANLADANFTGANLSYATLKNANLARTILKRAQLDGADLTGACLTGAYIEDWGITGETKLDGVQCEYVYMHVPTKDNPDPLRKPDNRNEVFEDGDFADFIKPIVDTLDLYHNQGVDPRAIAIALKNLAEDNPEAELEIVAMEKRGKDKFLLRAKTALGVDKSELSQAYFVDYNQLKALPAEQLILLIAEKGDRIRSLENMITTALQRPTFYTETYQHQGNFMPENSGININAGRDIGDVSGLVGGDVSGVVNLGEISGNVTNTINQLPASPQPDEPGIKELLEQLHRAIESAEELKPEDKAEALKQVQALAEAGKDPAEAEKKNMAKSAIRWFKGMLTELAEPSAIAQLCKKLLPHIATIFGL